MTDMVSPRQITATSVQDVATRVLAFGRHVAMMCPRRSFMVLARPARGQRKPRGFDAALRAEELNCEAWLHVTLAHPVAHADGPGVVSWGGRFTPFCLDGHDPVWPDAGPDALACAAQRSLGFYGWLRAVAFRLAQLVGEARNPMDVRAEGALRAAYGQQRHPFDVAAEAAAADQVARHAAA
ncbi:hypothetical protein [Komagataeibacter sp. FNDCR2]|uniref:hypothetical protein n=1 Tax=Komagataeibacter sp. FNDCR2 TaxID=2878682 RepID=UPI001E572AB6|nr:hypothetical protein [Komagataeibacter sp. FNDCR2]MCE2576719.1 hypothetical protein [Komagataeibacter sp. FNDCR2]